MHVACPKISREAPQDLASLIFPIKWFISNQGTPRRHGGVGSARPILRHRSGVPYETMYFNTMSVSAGREYFCVLRINYRICIDASPGRVASNLRNLDWQRKRSMCFHKRIGGHHDGPVGVVGHTGHNCFLLYSTFYTLSPISYFVYRFSCGEEGN